MVAPWIISQTAIEKNARKRLFPRLKGHERRSTPCLKALMAGRTAPCLSKATVIGEHIGKERCQLTPLSERRLNLKTRSHMYFWSRKILLYLDICKIL